MTAVVPSQKMPANLNQLSIEELEDYEGPEVRVESAELFDKDDKWKLLGVRHYITKVTYRPVVNEGVPADYVSVEARIASAKVLQLRIEQERIPNIRKLDQLIELGVEPGGSIVYNDGSTGIRQQLTYMFHSMGLIVVSNIPPHEVNVKNKEFTKPFQEWDSIGDQKYLGTFEGDDYEAPEIFMRDSGNPLLIRALGGLRVSDYTYDGKAAQTYYLN